MQWGFICGDWGEIFLIGSEDLAKAFPDHKRQSPDRLAKEKAKLHLPDQEGHLLQCSFLVGFGGQA